MHKTKKSELLQSSLVFLSSGIGLLGIFTIGGVSLSVWVILFISLLTIACVASALRFVDALGRPEEMFQKVNEITSQPDIGVSFSIKECGHYGEDWQKALKYTIDLGFRRFRLMSYWDVHEATEGDIDFTDLDKQIEIIEKAGGYVTLAIGMRQPRWPETHLPQWTKELSNEEVEQKYIKYHRKVIEHFKDNATIQSWQLENEFWLRNFGESFNFDRKRLNKEFNLIRQLDPLRPIIMSTAKVISLPLLTPTPDIYSTSVYRNIYSSDKKKYTKTSIKPETYKIRRYLTLMIKNRDTIIHELQMEPWGPSATWKMSVEEQYKSMNPEELKLAISYAQQTSMTYIDTWGAEWWYWVSTTKDQPNVASTVKKITEKYNKS